MLGIAMTILVGKASWADKSLVDSGKFYPPDVTSPEKRLRYYASVPRPALAIDQICLVEERVRPQSTALDK
jgi:hypothetical protein